jgi:hypothetical protein
MDQVFMVVLDLTVVMKAASEFGGVCFINM